MYKEHEANPIAVIIGIVVIIVFAIVSIVVNNIFDTENVDETTETESPDMFFYSTFISSDNQEELESGDTWKIGNIRIKFSSTREIQDDNSKDAIWSLNWDVDESMSDYFNDNGIYNEFDNPGLSYIEVRASSKSPKPIMKNFCVTETDSDGNEYTCNDSGVSLLEYNNKKHLCLLAIVNDKVYTASYAIRGGEFYEYVCKSWDDPGHLYLSTYDEDTDTYTRIKQIR